MLTIYLYTVLVCNITDFVMLWSVRYKSYVFWLMLYTRPQIAVKMCLGSFLILPSIACIIHAIYWHLYNKDLCVEWSDEKKKKKYG